MTLITDIHQHVGSDFLDMSVQHRLERVETMRIWYPRMTLIFETMRENHERNKVAAEPQCLMIVGDSGVGKTTLLHSYRALFPVEQQAELTRIPVLKTVVPAQPTPRNFAARLLAALGDSFPDAGSTGAKETRLLRLLKDCGVEVLMVDDLQHFVHQHYVLLESSNWLKNVIKESAVACVFAGIPEGEQVLIANSQLGRLFGDPHYLEPFTWDETNPRTKEEFRTFLSEVEKLLPLPKRSNLASTETACRCFVACNGNMAYLMNLIRRAAEIAIKQNHECLDMNNLSIAFDKRLAGARRGIPNPFIGDLSAPSNIHPAVNEPSVPATNNRSRRRKPQTLKFSDIL